MEEAVIAVKLTWKAGSGKRRTKTHNKPKRKRRDGTESRTALLGRYLDTAEDKEWARLGGLDDHERRRVWRCVCRLSGWMGGGGGWKGEKESEGSWSGGHRRAEGGRAADGDQWAPTLLSDQDRALDGGPWRGSGTVGRTVQWLSGWEMGGCGPPESQAFQKPRRRAPPPLCLPPQVGSGPGWDGIGCPQALAPSRNPFVSERKGGSNVFERRRCGSGSRAVVQFARVSPASMLCLLICSQRATLCSTTVYLLRMYSGKGGPKNSAPKSDNKKKAKQMSQRLPGLSRACAVHCSAPHRPRPSGLPRCAQRQQLEMKRWRDGWPELRQAVIGRGLRWGWISSMGTVHASLCSSKPRRLPSPLSPPPSSDP